MQWANDLKVEAFFFSFSRSWSCIILERKWQIMIVQFFTARARRFFFLLSSKLFHLYFSVFDVVVRWGIPFSASSRIELSPFWTFASRSWSYSFNPVEPFFFPLVSSRIILRSSIIMLTYLSSVLMQSGFRRGSAWERRKNQKSLLSSRAQITDGTTMSWWLLLGNLHLGWQS